MRKNIKSSLFLCTYFGNLDILLIYLNLHTNLLYNNPNVKIYKNNHEKSGIFLFLFKVYTWMNSLFQKTQKSMKNIIITRSLKYGRKYV